jgi:putative copper resistance protein D
VILVAVALAVGYALGVRRLAARGRRWPVSRTIPFVLGVVLLAGFSEAGLGRADASSFTVHMLEHVAVGMVAPVLLALGAPVTLALQTSPRRAGLRRVVRSRFVATVTHPVVAWVLFGVTPFVLYFTAVFDLSLRNGFVHALVHVHLLLVGCLFAWPAVGRDPVGHRLPYGGRVLYLFLAVPFHAVLGLALVSSRTPLAGYSLADQHAAGGVVWAAGDLFGLLAGGAAVLQWMAADEREARRLDAVG